MSHRLALTCLAAGALALGRDAGADERVVWLREEGAVASPPPGAIAPAAAPASEAVDRSVEQAREALAEARRLYLAYAFSDAAATLQRAGARAHAGLLRVDRGLAVELALWSGACALLADDREASRAAFRRALGLDGAVTLPSGVFPPEVERGFDELRRAAAAEGDGSRTIRSAPAGARVELDGRAEGATPVTLRLSPGVHHLRLERVGYRPWSGSVASEGEEREVFLAEASGAELRAQLGRRAGLAELPDAATLARIRREYGAAAVVVARRDGGTLRYPPAQAGPTLWPWIVGGSALAVGAGVLIYFVTRPEPRFDLVAP